MVAQNFAPSLACLNVSEGGKDDDPRDPGGRTAYGVTQARYNQYLRDKGRPRADVWGITVPEREEIWHTYYWQVCRCDELPAGLDYVVFDGAANSGPAQSVKWLQRAINDVRAKTGDGGAHWHAVAAVKSDTTLTVSPTPTPPWSGAALQACVVDVEGVPCQAYGIWADPSVTGPVTLSGILTSGVLIAGIDGL